jgi:hypothetical protein
MFVNFTNYKSTKSQNSWYFIKIGILYDIINVFLPMATQTFKHYILLCNCNIENKHSFSIKLNNVHFIKIFG